MKTMDACENAKDEAVTYSDDEKEICGDNSSVKRELPLDEEDNIAERPPKKGCTDLATTSLTIRQALRRSRKKRQEEEHWKEYGHLPRPSTTKKYVSGSQVWKTSLLITKLRMCDGGYTSRANNFQNVTEIQSLDDAMSRGFVLIKSQNL